MKDDQLKAMFPRASKDFIEANPHLRDLKDLIERGQQAQKVVNELTKATGKLRGARQPNKTEAEFGRILEAQKRKGEILRYEFEGITLRWGDMRYTPDFVVVWNQWDYEAGPATQLRMIEVKGAHIWDRDIVRYKGAKAAWPEFMFQMWQRKKGLWNQLD